MKHKKYTEKYNNKETKNQTYEEFGVEQRRYNPGKLRRIAAVSLLVLTLAGVMSRTMNKETNFTQPDQIEHETKEGVDELRLSIDDLEKGKVAIIPKRDGTIEVEDHNPEVQ